MPCRQTERIWSVTAVGSLTCHEPDVPPGVSLNGLEVSVPPSARWGCSACWSQSSWCIERTPCRVGGGVAFLSLLLNCSCLWPDSGQNFPRAGITLSHPRTQQKEELTSQFVWQGGRTGGGGFSRCHCGLCHLHDRGREAGERLRGPYMQLPPPPCVPGA